MLSQLGNDAGSIHAEGQAQRHLLAQIERTLASGVPLPPASARNEIAGVIASATHLGQQIRAASEHRASVELAAVQTRTRGTVMDISRDIYERRIFDPFLRFASPEEEAVYREREEINRRAIAEALAEGTPEGDLRAARLVRRQLTDAGAHGADASPGFTGRMSRINRDIEDMERAAGIPELSRADGRQDNDRAAPASQSPPPASDDQLASVLATFRTAGIAGGVSTEESAHGLNVDRPGGRSPLGLG